MPEWSFNQEQPGQQSLPESTPFFLTHTFQATERHKNRACILRLLCCAHSLPRDLWRKRAAERKQQHEILRRMGGEKRRVSLVERKGTFTCWLVGLVWLVIASDKRSETGFSLHEIGRKPVSPLVSEWASRR